MGLLIEKMMIENHLSAQHSAHTAHEILLPFITQKTQAKTLKITFFNWMTLIFDL